MCNQLKVKPSGAALPDREGVVKTKPLGWCWWDLEVLGTGGGGSLHRFFDLQEWP